MQRQTDSKKGIEIVRGRDRERGGERDQCGLWTQESRLSSFYMTTVWSFAEV